MRCKLPSATRALKFAHVAGQRFHRVQPHRVIKRNAHSSHGPVSRRAHQIRGRRPSAKFFFDCLVAARDAEHHVPQGDGRFLSARSAKSFRTMTTVTPLGPRFFCAPAKISPNLDTSMGREAMSEDMSATSGAGLAGSEWYCVPSMVLLVQR